MCVYVYECVFVLEKTIWCRIKGIVFNLLAAEIFSGHFIIMLTAWCRTKFVLWHVTRRTELWISRLTYRWTAEFRNIILVEWEPYIFVCFFKYIFNILTLVYEFITHTLITCISNVMLCELHNGLNSTRIMSHTSFSVPSRERCCEGTTGKVVFLERTGSYVLIPGSWKLLPPAKEDITSISSHILSSL